MTNVNREIIAKLNEVVIDFSTLDTPPKKQQAYEQLKEDYDNAVYRAQGSLNRYENGFERKGKYQADLSSAEAEITAVEDILKTLPAESPLIQEFKDRKTEAEHTKFRAEKALRRYGNVGSRVSEVNLKAEQFRLTQMADQLDALGALI